MIILFVIISLILLGVLIFIANEKPALPISYLPVDSRSYKTPPGWKGTPVDRKGRFVNSEHAFYQNYFDIFFKFLPRHAWHLLRSRPLQNTIYTHTDDSFLSADETLIWLGHASFFLRFGGYNILIDPHFNNTAVYKRHTANPIRPEAFRGIDYILISHDHADHLDKRSIDLLLRNNPGATVLTGLKMDETVCKLAAVNVKCQTTDWYQAFSLPGGLAISFVPSRHYCKRIWKKFNGSLWGGFVISCTNEGKQHTIYFAGDSGYGQHFKAVKDLFKPDLAIIGIGAFKPEKFMEPNHMSPEEALVAFDDTGATEMIPMHYGTFNLGCEHMSEPLTRLMNSKGNRNVIPLEVGASYSLSVSHTIN
jgi:L-ascorbate metabolism protein UlaG (beta-lactamase superfamily)